MEIKLVLNKESIIPLVWDVFLEYVGNTYSEEGKQEFYQSITDKQYLDRLTIYGAYENGVLNGIIASRNNGNYIALFFVDSSFQGKGIGRALLNCITKENQSGFLFVNSSPYAVPIYEHFGFKKVYHEQCVNGIRFIPMMLSL